MIKIIYDVCIDKIQAVLHQTVTPFNVVNTLSYKFYKKDNMLLTFEKSGIALSVLYWELVHNQFLDDIKQAKIDNLDNSKAIARNVIADKLEIIQNDIGYQVELKKGDKIMFTSLIDDETELAKILWKLIKAPSGN